MESFELFQQIKNIHGPLAGLTFLIVIISDLYGLTWILGKQKYLKKSILNWMHKIVFAGLLGLILTGSFLIFLDTSYLQNYFFLGKLFFVCVLFWNSFRIGKEMYLPTTEKFVELSETEKTKMLVVGITSFVSWVSVFVLIFIK